MLTKSYYDGYSYFSAVVFSVAASVVPAVCLVAVNIAQCNHLAIFLFMGIGTTCMGGMFSGVLSNHIDIAPNFAGIYFFSVR